MLHFNRSLAGLDPMAGRGDKVPDAVVGQVNCVVVGGGAGNEILRGNGGNDQLDGGGGGDDCNGGTGTNR